MSRRIMVAPLFMSTILLVSAPAYADPEKSYQAGKALSGTPPVDDRGIDQRAAQQMKDWGSGNKNSNAWKVDPNYNKATPPGSNNSNKK